MPIVKDVKRASSAFSTPNVVHFGAVLLLSAVISAPWQGIAAVSILWGVMGMAGVIYVVIVARHMRIQSAYTPQLEDRLFHILLPFAAYATLVGSAYAVRSNVGGALFGVGAAVLLLLFIGIHNAWDAVTYHVFVKRREQPKAERRH
jgi:hypothetical protein